MDVQGPADPVSADTDQHFRLSGALSWGALLGVGEGGVGIGESQQNVPPQVSPDPLRNLHKSVLV